MKKISFLLILLGLFLVPAIMQAQDTQEDEDVSHTLGYGTHSSYVIADVDQFDLIAVGENEEFVIRNKSQKRLKYHVVVELNKLSGTIDDEADSTFVVSIHDKVAYAEDYTSVKTDTLESDSDDYTVSITTDNFRIAEFIKIKLENTDYEAVEMEVESMFIKIVEE